MRQISVISLLLFLLFSCEKKNGLKTDCFGDPPVLHPVTCNANLCQSDTCQTYLAIWKQLFLEKNHMSQEYFNDHITPCSSHINKWADGFSYRISYKIKFDWVEVSESDQLIIWLHPSTAGLYPSLSLPRNTLLSKNQISSALTLMAFSSSLNTIDPLSRLKFSSYDEAMADLADAAGVENFCGSEIFYEGPHMVDPPSGHPILRATATISEKENNCISATVDLVTGENEIQDYPCVIWFCFTEGTQVLLNDGSSKPIEDINVNDTILSVDMNTMKIEKDVVRKKDVVTHENIISITFSDGTVNNNTADHPYYVEGKGWCSYRPSETLQKYNIKAKQLQQGDKCLKYAGNKLIGIQVTGIAERPGTVKTYNISGLQKNSNYFANGVLVSNENY